MTQSGIFITFEGGEGSGKSTQMKALARLLAAADYDVLCLREPGGTVSGEAIRAILLDPSNTSLCIKTELLLYEAARAQIVEEHIAPALQAGKVVLCDRFIDSTTVYQGYGRGLPFEIIDQLNRFAMGDCVPQCTIFLELPSRLGLKRATQELSDRIERAGDEFHSRVHSGFMSLAASDPKRVRIIHTCAEKTDTLLSIYREIAEYFPQLSYDMVRDLIAKDGARYFEKRQA